MKLQGIKPGDIVACNRLGRRFFALVEPRHERGVLNVSPLDCRITYRQVKAREVIGHWSKRA